MPLEGITRFCFAASYAVALLLELIQLVRPRPAQRLAAIACGCAGLLAHTLFLAFQQPYLSSQFGSLLFLAWILAVFYLYGSVHHHQVAWGAFVLPVVLGLVALTHAYEPTAGPSYNDLLAAREHSWRGLFARLWDLSTGTADERPFPLLQLWGLIHVSVLLLAAVGVCVAFVASTMYLVQAHRLRIKMPLRGHERLMSLERLEQMNRRAVIFAFPLLTIGALLGVVLMLHRPDLQLQGWTDPRIVGTGLLWIVCILLLFLRYAGRLGGRQFAQLTIIAFLLMLFTLAFSHSSTPGDGP